MENILDEYDQQKIKSPRFYYSIIIIYSVFLCFSLLSLVVDMETLTWRGYNNHGEFLISSLLPAIGFSFLLVKSKIGWFISTTYFSFMALLIIVSIINILISSKGNLSIITFNVNHSFLALISFSLSFLLQTKIIRSYYKVSNVLWIIVGAIALVLLLCIIFADN